MNATVAAALKRVVVAILSDKKLRKKVVVFLLSGIVVVIMPVAAVLGIFSGKFEFTDDQITQIADSIEGDALAKLIKVDSTLGEIQQQMTSASIQDRFEEAKILYLCGLYDYQDEKDFVIRLVRCYQENEHDKQLIEAINKEFGCNIDPDEYIRVVVGFKDSTINNDIFKDPATKNNIDLVAWANEAYDDSWGYVWGTYGNILTKSSFESLAKNDPAHVGKFEDYIRTHWLDRRCADCVGLIKGYLWYNPESHEISYGHGGFPDGGANSYYYNSAEKGPISSIPEIPGLGVWHQGHVGIYIGDGYVIQAMGTRYGVVKTKLVGSGFTNWFKIKGIKYLEPDE